MKIKSLIKKIALFLIPNSIKREIINIRLKYINVSYSQEGEDLILDRIITNKSNGYFIDVGAHHPKRFSNTYKLYKRGWRGINIDPLPESKRIFDTYRSYDINLELGISEFKSKLIYFSFNEPALNTFNEREAKLKNEIEGYFIKEKIELDTYPLSEILDKYLPTGTQIDLLNIDVEGLDLEVLKSNNWEKYQPNYILVEELLNDLDSIINDSLVYKYLKNKGYKICYRTCNTSFYKKI